MAKLTLVIGSKNLCPWSLAPWLLLKQTGIVFEEKIVRLEAADAAAEIARLSPSRRLPVLMVDDVPIWDSLAIAEFLAEHVTTLWPVDPQTRAEARSIAAEVHSEFRALQDYLPTDFTGRFDPPGKLLLEVEQDVARVQAIWQGFRRRFQAQGPYLCGTFSIADAMYTGICAKFTTHAIPLVPEAEAYRQTMMALPAIQEWADGAALEVRQPVTAALARPITPPLHAPAAPTPTAEVAIAASPRPEPPVVAPPEPIAAPQPPPVRAPTPPPPRPATAPLLPPRPEPVQGSALPMPRPQTPLPPLPEPVPRSARSIRPIDAEVGEMEQGAPSDAPQRQRRHWLRSPMFRDQRPPLDAPNAAPPLPAEDTPPPAEPPRAAPAQPEARQENSLIKPIGAGTLRRR